MLKINKDVWDAVVNHTRQEAPLEACGYLGEGGDGVVLKHYPLTNIDASEEHYALSPEEQFAAVRQMRGAGQKPRAIYHSHPASPARPSEEDIRLAYDPDISYVIVSLAEPQATVKSFRIRGTAVEIEEIEILEERKI